MKRCAVIFLALLLALPVAGNAMTAIFFQPQTGDRTVPAARWPDIFTAARSQGFDTLVVQWSAQGDALTGNLVFGPDDAAGHAWLLQRLREARKAGLQLVIGLGADADFFARQQANPGRLETYLRALRRQDRRIAAAWRAELGAGAIAGWYVPLEIDDRRWREPSARTPLLAHLRAESALGEQDGVPVYASTFFAGNMAPDQWTDLLRQLEQTGVRLWVQDGAGTGKLTAVERALYLAPVQRCDAQVAHGIVYEIFRQTAPDAAFAAEAAAPGEAHGLLAQRAPCDKDSVFFELRYLPALGGALPVH